MRDYFRKLTTLRTTRECFTRGDFETLYAAGDVFAFRRGAGDDQAVVILNAGAEETTVSVSLGDDVERLVSGTTSPTGIVMATIRDNMTGAVVAIDRSGGGASVTVTLPPLTGRVYTLVVAQIMSHPHGGK